MHEVTTNRYRLSPQQKRLWTLARTGEAYLSRIACRVEGSLDYGLIREAIRTVMQNHEIFRTCLRSIPGLKFPVQEIVDERKEPEFCVMPLSDAPRDAFELLARQTASQNPNSPLEVTLIPHGPAEHTLLIAAPAVNADFRTLQNVVREIVSRYEDIGKGSSDADPVQYADYSEWRNESADRSDDLRREGLAYWTRHAIRDHLLIRVPGQNVEARPEAFIPRFLPVELGAEVSERLATVAEREATSIEAVLAAAWISLLSRYANVLELPIGVITDGRLQDELSLAMGPYAQSVPLRARLRSNTTFSELVRDVSQALAEVKLFQNDFEASEASSGLSSFGFRYQPRVDLNTNRRISIRVLAETSVIDRFDLLLTCSHSGSGILGCLSYDPGVFSPEAIERIGQRWKIVCAGIGESPSTRVIDLPVLTEQDRDLLCVSWNSTRIDSHPESIHELFEKQVEQTPNATAVVCGDRRLTYAELNASANRLAKRLRDAGVGTETPVGVFVGRSVELIVSILGVLKAGGAYVPLDTAYPVKHRIAHVLRETEAPVVLTQERFLPYLPEGSCRAINVESEPEAYPADAANLRHSSGPENLAYIIYTSGSTGTPKGVMVNHRSAANLFHALYRSIYEHEFSAPFTATLNAPVSFDASVKQILLLLGGNTLHIIPEEVRGDAQRFAGYLQANRIDVLDCTPSHLRVLLEAGLLDAPEVAPKVCLVGGEPIDPALWNRLSHAPSRFSNVYGPTECTVDATICPISQESQPSIGSPVSNVQAYILNGRLELQPIGVPGELHIAGAGLARGYWNQAGLTAARFVPNPFSQDPGERLYRTGDLARYRPDGRIEHIGRIDHQVKIRGFRVELGDIAAALLQHPGVREAVVTTSFEEADNSRVVAYVVPGDTASATATELRAFLADRLPEYMIPAAYVTLDALPLTANGKIDRKALPAPDLTRREQSRNIRPPSTSTEAAVARIWSTVLKTSEIAVDDNFFELGGHSLLAMQVISRVRKEFAIDLPLPRLFQNPTIEALSKAIDDTCAQTLPTVASHALDPAAMDSAVSVAVS